MLSLIVWVLTSLWLLFLVWTAFKGPTNQNYFLSSILSWIMTAENEELLMTMYTGGTVNIETHFNLDLSQSLLSTSMKQASRSSLQLKGVMKYASYLPLITTLSICWAYLKNTKWMDGVFYASDTCGRYKRSVVFTVLVWFSLCLIDWEQHVRWNSSRLFLQLSNVTPKTSDSDLFFFLFAQTLILMSVQKPDSQSSAKLRAEHEKRTHRCTHTLESQRGVKLSRRLRVSLRGKKTEWSC